MQLSRFSFLSTQSTFSLSSVRVHYTTEKLISFTSALALWMRTHQSSVQGFEYIIVHIESKIWNMEYYFSFQKLRVNVLDPVNLNNTFQNYPSSESRQNRNELGVEKVTVMTDAEGAVFYCWLQIAHSATQARLTESKCERAWRTLWALSWNLSRKA